MSTDDPDTDDLAERFPHVAELEQALEEADIDVADIDVDDIAQQTGATRRDVLTGSAGLLGLGALLTGGSGTASAGTDQVGSIGTDNNRLDAEIEDLDLTDQSSVPAGPGSGQVRMYFRDGTPYYLPAGGSETQLGGSSSIFEDTNSDGVYEQTTGNGIETGSVSADQISNNVGSKGATYIVYNDGGVYKAADAGTGSVAYQDATPDLGALLNTISTDINPSPGVTGGDSEELQILLQPREATYKASTTVEMYTGLRFSLTAPGQLGAIIEWTGATTDRVINYDGTSNNQTAPIGYKYSTFSLSNVGILWNQDRDADVIYLADVSTWDIRNVFAQFTDFDLSDRVKTGESVTTVPSGNHYFVRDDTTSSEYRTLENCWIVGCPQAAYIEGDHYALRNVQAFYCNPPTTDGQDHVFRFGPANDVLATGLHIYECSGNGIKNEVAAGNNCVVHASFEDTPPSGYNAVLDNITQGSSHGVTLLGYKGSRSASNVASGGSVAIEDAEPFDSQAYMATAQSVSSTTITKVEFDAVEADERGQYDTATFEYTCPFPGDYKVVGSLKNKSDLTDGSKMAVQIRVNGTAIGNRDFFASGTNNPSVPFAKVLPDLSAGDTIDIAYYQDSGSTIDLNEGDKLTYVSFAPV